MWMAPNDHLRPDMHGLARDIRIGTNAAMGFGASLIINTVVWRQEIVGCAAVTGRIQQENRFSVCRARVRRAVLAVLTMDNVPFCLEVARANAGLTTLFLAWQKASTTPARRLEQSLPASSRGNVR